MAFRDVKLEDGIGLWEAQAIDDYESKENQLAERMRDIKDNWQLIPADDLAYCESSLTFCDGKGMRFHLPAFIMLELNNEGTGSVLYNLTHYYKFNKEKFNILNSDQKHAVATFLEWCFMEPNYEFDKPHIQRAIEEYWYEN